MESTYLDFGLCHDTQFMSSNTALDFDIIGLQNNNVPTEISLLSFHQPLLDPPHPKATRKATTSFALPSHVTPDVPLVMELKKLKVRLRQKMGSLSTESQYSLGYKVPKPNIFK